MDKHFFKLTSSPWLCGQPPTHKAAGAFSVSDENQNGFRASLLLFRFDTLVWRKGNIQCSNIEIRRLSKDPKHNRCCAKTISAKYIICPLSLLLFLDLDPQLQISSVKKDQEDRWDRAAAAALHSDLACVCTKEFIYIFICIIFVFNCFSNKMKT